MKDCKKCKDCKYYIAYGCDGDGFCSHDTIISLRYNILDSIEGADCGGDYGHLSICVGHNFVCKYWEATE